MPTYASIKIISRTTSYVIVQLTVKLYS